MNTKILFMLFAATLFLKGDSHSAAPSDDEEIPYSWCGCLSRLFGWGSARVAPAPATEPDPESGLPTSTDEIRGPEGAGAAIAALLPGIPRAEDDPLNDIEAALPAPPEVRPEIWKPKQIKDELKRVFITEEPETDSEFFNETIRYISAHVLLPEARFKSLFTALSKDLEGDFYTHLYGPRPSFNTENVTRNFTFLIKILAVGGVLGAIYQIVHTQVEVTGLMNPENYLFLLGVGGAIIGGTFFISCLPEVMKFGFEHARNFMQCDYRGWCCGSTGCCRPNEDDVRTAGKLSKLVSILVIARNAEALGAMSDEDALDKLQRKIRTSLESEEIKREPSLAFDRYFLAHSELLKLS